MGSDAYSDRSSYDVFLSYNSADHGVVEDVARKLRDEGLEPFLDRWYLAPGMRWRSELEKKLSSSKAVAIFVGPGEMGSWQQREVDVALDLQSRNPNFPVIPVLLPGCEPPLGFLRQLTWVDLRSQPVKHGIAVLSKAARGESPGPDLQNHLNSVRTSICPYRGLLHFREEDAPFFFGREAAIDKLVHTVKRQPCVAVVGASGSGKSSIVRAGLLPRLRNERFAVWETVTLVPTDQPLKALAGTFVPLLEPAASEVERLAEAGKLAEHFTSRTISLLDVVLRILDKQRGTDRMLIVVDQFEELYTLCSDDNARGRFLDELLTASSCLGSRVTVVIALRGDFVGKAFAHRSLSDRLQDAQVNLGPMTREELESAVRKPAEKIQLEFEPGLVQRILDAVGDAPGNLPLLEFALRELWENRRGQLLLNETYEAMGELKGALAKKASDFFGKLSLADQKVLQRVFLRIVHPSPESGHDTRRRAAFVELPPEARDLVVKLADERLLVTNQSVSGPEQTVEIAHEALISNWSILRGWINEDREFLLWRERLGALLAEWKRAEGNEDALLRGPLLFEAQKWVDQRSQDLSRQEGEFIAVSRELQERLAREKRERQEQKLQSARKLAETERQRAEVESKARRRQSYLIIALVGLLLLAGFVAVIAVWEGASARTAENTARAAENRTSEVASQAHVSLARDCLEAGKDAEALGHLAQAVRLNQRNYEAAALVGAMLTQTSWPLPVAGPMWHGDLVLAAQFSPDCQRVLTVSNDKTVRLWDVASGKKIGEPMKHDGWVRSAQFSPDSQSVLTTSGIFDVSGIDATGGESSGTRRFTAQLWDVASGKPLGEPMEHEGEVNSAQFSPDGQRIVTASNDETAQLWDAASGQPLGEPMEHKGEVNSAQFSPDGQRVVTASSDKTAQLWDVASGRPLGEPMTHQRQVILAQFSPDGQRVVTASDDNTTRLWDAASGKPLGEPMKHQDRVILAQFSPDGQRVVTASQDGRARLWDALTGKAIGEPMEHHTPIHSVQFSPDGQRIVTTSRDKMARLWNAATGKSLGEPMKHGGGVYSAQFSPDGQRVVTTSEDGRARRWDAENRKSLGEPMKHEGWVYSAQFSPDGRRIVTASQDGTARLWDAATGKALSKPMKHGDGVSSAQFSPDGQRVVTASFDGTARLWDAATGKPLGEPMKHGSGVSSAQFSPDGQRVVTASSDETARLWEAVSGKPLGEPMKHGGGVYSAQFSPDGQRVVTTSWDRTARLWDAATGKPLGESMKHGGGVYSARFSPDGRRVVTTSEDGMARLWDAATGKPLGEPMKHEDRVVSAQFSPDGQRVLTASWDKTARLWDALTGKAIGEPMRHAGWIKSAQFSPDGQRVVTASSDESARIWDIPTISSKENAEDVLLLADFAEASGGLTVLTSGEAETLSVRTPEEIGAILEKIAIKFPEAATKLTPLQRFLKWGVSERRSRTISPFSDLTVAEWIENRINEGTLDGLRTAMQEDSANARLAAHFGRCLANYALEKETDPDEARRARGEADFQTRRALSLAPENDEVKKLRAEVVRLLNLAPQ